MCTMALALTPASSSALAALASASLALLAHSAASSSAAATLERSSAASLCTEDSFSSALDAADSSSTSRVSVLRLEANSCASSADTSCTLWCSCSSAAPSCLRSLDDVDSRSSSWH